MGSDPNRRPEAALVQAELGRVYSAREDFASAEKAFGRSLDLYRQLIAESPEESPHRAALDYVYEIVFTIAHLEAADAREFFSKVDQRRLVTEKCLRVLRLDALVPIDWAPPGNDPRWGKLMQVPVDLFNAAKWLDEVGRSAEAEASVSRSFAEGETLITHYANQIYVPLYWCVQAQARSLRGRIRFTVGRQREAESDYQQALALFAKLKPDEVDFMGALPDFAWLEQARGELLWTGGDKQPAALAFRRAEELWRRIKHPKHHLRDNELAWLLATCPDEHFRKSEEAVALSEKAITLRPKDGPVWRTRGVALLRAGRHRDAAEALEKGVQLGDGGDALDWFFLAMARWKLEDKEKAREWFDRAAGWTDKNRPHDPVLRRFRAEAATLLGIKDASAMKSKEVSPQGKRI